MMADKLEAKSVAEKIGLPILPGSSKNVKFFSDAKKISKEIGYPILIKATNGGGGRGIKKVQKEEELKENFILARKEAEQSFGNDNVYLEKFLDNPRHIEANHSRSKGNIIHLENVNAQFKGVVKKL